MEDRTSFQNPASRTREWKIYVKDKGMSLGMTFFLGDVLGDDQAKPEDEERSQHNQDSHTITS